MFPSMTHSLSQLPTGIALPGDLGRTAISTLIEPPMSQTGLLPRMSSQASSHQKPPNARDIPPVTLTKTTHVDAAEFKPYLTQVGALYDELQRIKDDRCDAIDVRYRRDSESKEFTLISRDGYLQPERRPSMSQKYSIPPSPLSLHTESSGQFRRSRSEVSGPMQGLPSLSTVPSVYLEENFQLQNPRTFRVVSEGSEIIRSLPATVNGRFAADEDAAAPPKALATNAILQEKLSWYMDTIEMHLIAASLAASTTFFTVLGSLQQLHLEAIDSVKRIRSLRGELKSLDEEIANGGLRIAGMRQRCENVKQLHDTVIQLKHITSGVVSCETLVDNGEVERALGSIDSLSELIAGKADPSKPTPLDTEGRELQLKDLRGAIALQCFDQDLNTLRLRIGETCESRFLSLLIGDLRRHSESVSRQEVLTRWGSASARSRGVTAPDSSVFPSYMASTDDLRSDLLESLSGLSRARHLSSAAGAYRESALKEILGLIRRYLPSSNDDDNESVSSSITERRRQLSRQQKSAILADNLRALDPEDAEELLVKIYVTVAEMLRRLTTQVKLLLDVASSLDDDATFRGQKGLQTKSPQTTPITERTSTTAIEIQEIHRAIDQSTLLGQAVDAAQSKIVKLLRVRSEQSTHLSLTQFLRYFTLNLYFANECESISGRSGTNLKTVVNGQIKDFIQQHVEAAKQKLAQGMGSDKWDAHDFSEKDSIELSRILSCTTEDPTEWLEDGKIWIPYPDGSQGPIEPCVPQPDGDGKVKPRKASIYGEMFMLPYSAVLCMSGISQFLQLIVGIPSMIADIRASLVSYLQLFHSLCEQLILGAGARQSAGLKNITSKHLVLASQALLFVATITSYIREFVRRYSGNSGADESSLVEFDRVKRLCQEHQNKIYHKLVEIMSGLAASHVKAMSNINWDTDQDAVHPYMATLAKDTTSLYRVLVKTSTGTTIRMLMTLVFEVYRDKFGRAFQEIPTKTESGRDSMLRDIDFFVSKLGNMDGFGNTGEHLTTIIKSKQVGRLAPGVSTTPEPQNQGVEDAMFPAETWNKTENGEA